VAQLNRSAVQLCRIPVDEEGMYMRPRGRKLDRRVCGVWKRRALRAMTTLSFNTNALLHIIWPVSNVCVSSIGCVWSVR